MKVVVRPIVDLVFCSISDRDTITASISAREITRHMVRVRSSNLWAYTINIRNNGDKVGDVYVQFKGKNGGPDDIYCYFDVPVVIYRRWANAPSKGRYFWKYIRNNFRYAKLTGDKKTKQKGGINT